MENEVWEASAVEQEETRKGPWTADEDIRLTQCIDVHGEGRWNFLSRAAGLKRTGKSCRLRWLNYLRPDLKRGHITSDEESLILELHSRWGNRWSRIAKCLPGRTDNEIKNYWRTRMKKRASDGFMVGYVDGNQRFKRLAYSSQGLTDDLGMLRRGIGASVHEGNAATSSGGISRITDDVIMKEMHFAYPVSIRLEESNSTEQSIGAMPDQVASYEKMGFQLPGASYDYLYNASDRPASGLLQSMEGFDQVLVDSTLPSGVSASSEVDSLTDSRDGFSNGETSFWDYGVSDVLWNFDDYLQNI